MALFTSAFAQGMVIPHVDRNPAPHVGQAKIDPSIAPEGGA